jgi:predicted RNA-binding protein with PIN domain
MAVVGMPPSHRYLIVDGHSVIHAWEELARLHRVSARRHLAREELMKRMRHLQDMTGERVVVVFDGIGSRVSEEREKGGLQIFYADAGTTADTVIERLAARHATTHPLRVVTADGMIRDSIHSSVAFWLSPDSLRDECDRAEKEMRKRIAG